VRLLLAGSLVAVAVPSPAFEAARDLARVREQVRARPRTLASPRLEALAGSPAGAVKPTPGFACYLAAVHESGNKIVLWLGGPTGRGPSLALS
jgi:hypothetical protein